MSSQFLKPYYDAIATAAGKASLTGAFRESSELTFESEHFRGVAEISTKLRGQADAEGRVFVKPVPEGGRNRIEFSDPLPELASLPVIASPSLVPVLQDAGQEVVGQTV